jgi:integrase
MPERKPIKSDTDIRNAKPESAPYRRPVGRGLYLEVRPTGAKLWRYRYRLPNAEGIRRENLYAMGEYGKGGKDRGQFTLVEAEIERARLRELVKQGTHPVQERRERKAKVIRTSANTFKSIALKWLDTKRSSKSAEYIKQIERAFDNDVYPVIGDRPITAIDHADLSDIVDKKAATAPTVALLIQQWCGSVFRYAVKKRKASHDPSHMLRGTVERPPVKSKAPLLRADFPGFFEALEKHGGTRATKIALQLLLYTFVRPGELSGAPWPEFNLDAAIWKIPASRMKKGVEHWVPLSTEAVALLRELHKLTGGSDWLFPNVRDPKKPTTGKEFNVALGRMGYSGRFTAHGFRATAASALNDLGMRHDVIEAQLAHQERNKSRAAYNQATYWTARQELMQAWAGVVKQWAAGESISTSNVVALRAAS